MSRPGVTFGINHEAGQSTERGNVSPDTLRSPEAQQALALLQSRLLVRDGSSGQLEGLDIEQVEIYDKGLDPKYEKMFDSKDRQPGTLFVVKFRGTALVNVVVDPVKKSVVYIKAVSSPNEKSTSAASHLKRLIGDDFVEKLDGASLDNPEANGIELAQKGPGSSILDIVATVRGNTANNTQQERIILAGK